MRDRLRTLERQLACQRAQVLAQRAAEEYVEAFERALNDGIDTPDERDLVQATVALGVLPLRPGPILNHVRQCRQDHRAPNIELLVQLVVHGFARGRFRPNQRCACLARRPLAPFAS